MKRHKSLKNWFWQGIMFSLIPLLISGCYRNGVDDYNLSGSVSLSKMENGVLVPYNPQVLPRFKDGGYEGLLASIYNNLEYPAQARANQTEGSADIQFRLQPDGTVDEVTILKDLEDGCGEAAAAAVREGIGGNTYEPTGVGYDLYGFVRIFFKLH